MDAAANDLIIREPDAPTPATVTDNGRTEIRYGLAVLIAFFGIFLGWAAFAPLDAAVVANGYVVVSGNRQTVQHRDGGIISVLNVREGQQVEQGAILIELAAPELVAQERALFSQVIDFEMQRARLIAEGAGARSLQRPQRWAAFEGEDRAIAEEAYQRYSREGSVAGWSGYDARIAGYRDELAAIGRQEALLSEELSGMRALAAEGLVPMTRVRALDRALADLEGRRGELRAAVAATQQDRGGELRDVEARLWELMPQLASAQEQVERMRIRAPTAGAVVGLSVHTVGGVVRPGERLMDIVPDDQELLIEAQVRPEDADDITIGQTTEVRITAFSGRNLPLVDGAVRRISADRFVDERTGQAYFIVQIAVPPEEIDRIGRELRAGLPAQIVAPTEKRTALQYLIEPLNQAIWRSFRET